MIIRERLEALRMAGERVPPMRFIKTEEQIRGCREAGKINALVLDAVSRSVTPGISTGELDDIVTKETRALGAIPACLGYEGFPKSVCISKNNVICHGIPSYEDVLTEGDIVNVDCTTLYNGYYGDASRMYAIGKVSDVAERLIRVTGEAVELAVGKLAPYTSHLGDIGYYIASHARKNGFSVVREIGGHGVGLQMHEDPFVCHTGFLGKGIVLLPGMIFTIEPMINQGRATFTIDESDGWTVRTKDGLLSAQIEYEILITENGYEILCR